MKTFGRGSRRGSIALTECPQCGTDVSSLAEECPECGTDVSHGSGLFGRRTILLLVLIVGVLSAGYLYSPTLSSVVSRTLGWGDAELPMEKIDVGRLDAYQTCQDFLEDRLESEADTGVSLMPGWVSPGQITERISARRFRVESQLGYTRAGQSGVEDVAYVCEVEYRGEDDWGLRELTVHAN